MPISKKVTQASHGVLLLTAQPSLAMINLSILIDVLSVKKVIAYLADANNIIK
jgi:hypothetical protein